LIKDLRQDSETENGNIREARKENKKKYNYPLEFFGEPLYPDKAKLSPKSFFLSSM
jgi:hypothetical protein